MAEQADPAFVLWRDYVDQRWRDHTTVHESEAVAVEIARTEINRRLEDMNEFRSQLDRQAGTFMTRELYDREHQILENRVNQLERGFSNVIGRIAIYAALIAVAGGTVTAYILHAVGR